VLVTNQTNQDYWFGPLHLPAGVGSTLTVDDSSASSLYLLSDEVADAIAYLSSQGKISVSSVTAGIPFPRATGTPSLMHGDGSPEGLVFASQGSLYMRRDTSGSTDYLYVKTTGVLFNTGWVCISNGIIKPTRNTISNSTTEGDLFGTQGAGYTVTGNFLPDDGILRVKFGISVLNNSGSAANLTLRAYLGSTKWYDTGAVSVAANANSHMLDGELLIAMQNATNSEWASGWAAFGSTTAATAGFGNPLTGAAPQDAIQGAALSVDMTVAQALRLTVQFGTANAQISAAPTVILIEAL
jgi:hypothetical protein